MFENLKIEKWRQFEMIDIHFDSALTIITGANGSGKTTLLNILGRHFGWEVPMVRSPFKSKKEIVREFLDSHWQQPDASASPVARPSDAVGLITYRNGSIAYLVEPQDEALQFNVRVDGQIPVSGIHIPSHRPIPARTGVKDIPASPPTKVNAVENYRREVLARYLGQRSQKSPGLVLKETLMSLCFVTNSGTRVNANPDFVDTLEGFETILKNLLPPTFGFQRFEVELPELYLVGNGTRIPFDSLSGGIASLVDIAYQIFMYSPPDGEYVVIIDEPENHLHPEMQRMCLPNLLKAFPKVQFIIATHNPFIVGSVKKSRVYALVYQGEKVVSEFLDTARKTGTSEEILREVLGLASTLPIWVREVMDDVIGRYVAKGLSPQSIKEMSDDLSSLGLDNMITDTLSEFANQAVKKNAPN